MFTHLIFSGLEKQLVLGLEETTDAGIVNAANPLDRLRRDHQGKSVSAAFCEILADRRIGAKIQVLHLVEHNDPRRLLVARPANEPIQIPEYELDHRPGRSFVNPMKLEDVAATVNVAKQSLPTNFLFFGGKGIPLDERLEFAHSRSYRARRMEIVADVVLKNGQEFGESERCCVTFKPIGDSIGQRRELLVTEIVHTLEDRGDPLGDVVMFVGEGQTVLVGHLHLERIDRQRVVVDVVLLGFEILHSCFFQLVVSETIRVVKDKRILPLCPISQSKH